MREIIKLMAYGRTCELRYFLFDQIFLNKKTISNCKLEELIYININKKRVEESSNEALKYMNGRKWKKRNNLDKIIMDDKVKDLFNKRNNLIGTNINTRRIDFNSNNNPKRKTR